MRTNIRAVGIEHTNAIDAYVIKKLRDLEKLLNPKEESEVADVEVGQVTKHHQKGAALFFAEINFHVKGKKFRATAKTDDLYAAIDKVKDEIVREVAQFHDKKRDARKKGGREIKRRMVASA